MWVDCSQNLSNKETKYHAASSDDPILSVDGRLSRKVHTKILPRCLMFGVGPVKALETF